MIDLAANLPRLLPLAIGWVWAQETEILATGRVLTPMERQLALAVGVQQPDIYSVRHCIARVAGASKKNSSSGDRLDVATCIWRDRRPLQFPMVVPFGTTAS